MQRLQSSRLFMHGVCEARACKGVWGYASWFSEIASAHISAQINRVCSQMSIIQLTNYVTRLAQRVTAAGQLDVV